MHLKHLILHGFKTFPNETAFLFNSGITAIVGPNGSGKSNIADAIRWVLGEQSFNALRVKKTEELIFSGSSLRPGAGMAEVSLTLENLDPWHEETVENTESERVDPITELLHANLSEVTLGRRAYRDGQNEYFLNSARVRLRDILELLAHWGLARNTYAVVSQGLIDQALSLRPEERRALFEEAAGIGLYQSKRHNAIEKLEETQQNLLRVNDIINEIAPRLPSLGRQAERAKNYDGVVRALDDKLRTWYAFQWARAQQIAQDAAAREKSARDILNARRDQVQELAARLAQLRRQGQELRAQLAEGRRSRSQLERENASLSRELAILSERLRFTTQQRDEAASELAALQGSKRAQEEKISHAASELQKREQERDALATRLRETETQHVQFEHLAARTEVTEEENKPQVRDLARRLADLRSQLSIFEEALRIAASLSAHADALASLEEKRMQVENTAEGSRERVNELRTALALAERDVTSARSILESGQNMIAQWEAQMAAKAQRVESLTREMQSLAAQRDELQARFNESSRALAESDERLAPADAQLADAEKTQAELEEQESLLRARLSEFEEAHNRGVLDVERSRAEIARLETEIEDDLASGRIVSEIKVEDENEGAPRETAIALDTSLPRQLRLRLGDEFVTLPVVTAVPEGLEKEVRKLRNQLKYMGTVNPNAPQEYDELKARHKFLTEQAEDAQHAIASLHEAIAELDEIMHRKFHETFKAIHAEFAKFFTLLFEGGTARLELTQPDDLTQTGIEIIAKPPGKRAAHLGLLSGGERALTATALLFAILKVSPTPFCVMDEVDAMLDEANVGRFRDALKGLSEETQFIVITHNRATIESADAVYGITIGEDGVSQAISLRLDGKEKSVKQKVRGKKQKARKYA